MSLNDTLTLVTHAFYVLVAGVIWLEWVRRLIPTRLGSNTYRMATVSSVNAITPHLDPISHPGGTRNE